MAFPRVFCHLRLLINNEFFLVSKCSTNMNSKLLNKNIQVLVTRHFRTNLTIGSVLNKSGKGDGDEKDVPSSSSSSSDDTDSDDEDLHHLNVQSTNTKPLDSLNFLMDDNELKDNVTVEYHRGLPQVTVPLPSRRERCRFTLKPITNTVGDFLEMLKKEDKGIDRVVCKTTANTRIASSNTIETLLDEDFKLILNDRTYNVTSPKQERLTGEEIKRLSDVKNIVHQLYESLNIQEHQMQKEVEIVSQVENLRKELLPLEQQINDLELVAQRRSNWLAWAGLGLMSVQFGIMARLTWWEYSWDIMEPVTYFVTYGTAMAMYSYYVLTREEYVLTSVRDRQHLMIMHNKARKLGLDLTKYNTLQDEVSKLDRKLRKLKNPLKVTQPPTLSGAPAGSLTDQITSIKEELNMQLPKEDSPTSPKVDQSPVPKK